ncbi:MAG: asparaginase [Actinobacteria bacterium]|nr:asparaginase [Actinomycetota bacterium]
MADSHRILLLTTGGTIAGRVSKLAYGGSVLPNTAGLESLLGPTVAHLNARLAVDISVDTLAVADIDSSNATPALWCDLVTSIGENYDEFDAFVITHGTNTLGYTCAALSFALLNPSKPIVLTGSQVPAGIPGSDAQLNLENALRIATWNRQRSHPPIRGVVAVFGSQILPGTRVKKNSEFAYDAFQSFASNSIGRIGRIVDIDETSLVRHNSYLSTHRYPLAFRRAELLCEPEFDMRIASLTAFPGMSAEVLESVLASDVRALVLRAYGAGDVSDTLFEPFRLLKARKVPVVVTTQAPNGRSTFQANDAGFRLAQEGLAIPAYDMSIEAMTTKLGWLLSKMVRGDLSYSQLCDQMMADLRGEIHARWEVEI